VQWHWAIPSDVAPFVAIVVFFWVTLLLALLVFHDGNRSLRFYRLPTSSYRSVGDDSESQTSLA
jgi:hypothetical protein